MLKLGGNNISKLFLGSQAIAKAYLGNTLVYSSSSDVKFIDGIDNNASLFNFTSGSGMYDGAAVINTGIIPNASTYIKYSAWLYPIGTRTSGYVTGVYFGSLARDDSGDSFWVRAFVPDFEGTTNLQGRMGNRSSGFYPFGNSSLAFHVFELSNNGFFVDGEKKYDTSSPSFSPTPQYPIFCGGANLAGRCWRAYRQIITDVVITNSQGINMHLRPAIVEDEIGMVDVNNSNMFYGSATTKKFTEAVI